jgi:hypothetical protein
MKFIETFIINCMPCIKSFYCLASIKRKKSYKKISKQPIITSILLNSTPLTNTKAIAGAVNEFLATIADEIASLVNPTSAPDAGPDYNARFVNDNDDDNNPNVCLVLNVRNTHYKPGNIRLYERFGRSKIADTPGTTSNLL